MFFRYAYNKRTETRYTNGLTTGPAQDGQLPLWRINHTGVADWVRVANSTLVFNVRGGLNQYLELARSDPGLGFDPAELGFAPSLVNQLPNEVFPRLNFFTRTTAALPTPAGVEEYRQLGRNSRNRETTTGLSLQPNFTLTKSKHSVRGGLDMRMTWYTNARHNNLFVLNFDRRFTQRQFNQDDALSGNAIASFLLGAVTGGAIDNNFYPTLRWDYYAPWLQDDWRVTDRLTVNLGVRWDLNTPVFEEENRLNHGFDTETINPVTSRIQQQVPGYVVRGGLGFVDVERQFEVPVPVRRQQHPAARGLRLLDQRPHDRARRLRPLLCQRRQHLGVERVRRQLVPDHVSRWRPHVDLSVDESVSGRPARGARVVARPGDVPRPQPQLLERRLRATRRCISSRSASNGCCRGTTTVEVSYVGSRTTDMQNRWGGFNEPPLSLRDRCDPTKGGSPAFCNELLPNPFFGITGFEGTARFTSPTLSRYELSRPFPQFGPITEFDRNDGRIWYNSVQTTVNKRMSQGLSLNGTYTWSKMMEENGGDNIIGGNNTVNPLITEVDRVVQRSIFESDRRHRVTISGVYLLPFGRDGKFLSDAGPVLNAFVGGWEMAGMWLFNTGRPWGLPQNVIYDGNAKIEDVDYDDPRVIRASAALRGPDE